MTEIQGEGKEMRELVVGKNRVSDDGDCYVIAEIGHNHQGSLEKAIEMFKVAAECVTSCAFGGADLKTLYITTAGGDGDKSDQPEAGHLFAWESSVAGVPSSRFAG